MPSFFGQRKVFALRAWRGRCPQCGVGRLFAGYARLRERCPSCGLVYRREQGAMTGAMYVSTVVSELFAAALAVLLFLATDWSAAVAVPVGIALVVVFSYLWLPRAMALWVAVEYATDVSNGESWVSPRP